MNLNCYAKKESWQNIWEFNHYWFLDIYQREEDKEYLSSLDTDREFPFSRWCDTLLQSKLGNSKDASWNGK